MKLTKTISACLAAVGVMLAGSIGHAAPTISNITPSGAFQFQSSSTLSFTLASTPGITNVSVQLTGKPLTGGGAAVLRFLTAGNGLTVSGSSTSETLTANIGSNTLYTAVITAKDSSGTTAQTVNFNTIRPIYTWEAEDYDFSNGLFILEPQAVGGIPGQTNGYQGLASTLNVDYNHGTGGGGGYRPAPPAGLNTEGANDTPRVQYGSNAGSQGYDIGFNTGGDFGNYTRVYPAGTYLVFLRGANGANSSQNDAASLTVAHGNATIGGSGPYQFNVPGGGWQNWQWCPLLGSGNTPAQVTFDGLTNTLNVHIDGGNCNENFYMLVPTNANPSVTSSVSITNIYPDGSFQFEQTNKLAFVANSAVGINASDILVQLTGTTLAGQSSSLILTAGNGLVVTGSANSWSVSYSSLSNDIVYSAFIQVADVNGGITSTTAKFDTVSPTYYTFEAEDWNFQNGQYVDNPQTNAYLDVAGNGAYDGVSGVDFNLVSLNGGSLQYGGRHGLATENCGDQNRNQFTVLNPLSGVNYKDYDAGNANSGNWANYTRTFPAGAYNIYMRAANGNGANSDSASMYVVTSDRTQGGQTTSKLGTFAVPATSGWQTYQWVPLLNSASQIVTFTGGSVQTLRVTTDNGSYNANYYMLVPANTSVHNPPFVSAIYPDGTTLFQLTNKLAFTVSSSAGIANGGVTVLLNGVNVSGSLSFSGLSSSLNVTCPVLSNTLYTAIITVTDSYGTTSMTNKFETLDPNCYQFEAEDYDYTSGNGPGQFFDGQINAYSGQPSTQNVDEHDDHHQGDGYRPSSNDGSVSGLEVENPAGDTARPAFSGYIDYNIGYNDGGNWANYTHNYPPGTYNVYMRSANPNSPPGTQANAATLSIVTGGWGTTSQTTTTFGSFQVPYSGGWHSFAWAPLTDANGGLARITLTGTTNTLRVSVTGGNYNVNFYALVPADMSIPILNNAYPNGASRFQSSSTFSFGATSAAGISGSGVSVQLIGTNLLGQTIITNFTTANGLVVSGPSTNITVSLPLSANVNYTAIINVTSSNGRTTSSTLVFDTVNPSFLFEAEDFNYNSGLFIATAETNGYLNLNGVTNIDAHQTGFNAGSTPVYRTNALMNVENCGDAQKLASHASLQDYDVGNNQGGNWQNYTRNFPAGVYNVYLRGAGGNNIGGFFSDVASIGVVSGDVTSLNQTNLVLGTFNLYPIGWQVYRDLPMIDADGNYAQFVGGGQQTLRLTTDGGNYNANYVFLVPADTTLPVNPPHLKAAASGPNLVVSFLSRTNTTYQLVFKTNLTDPTWTPVGSTLVGSGNNLNVSVTNAATGSSGFYRLKTN